ncbi:6260_t:CDS:1, partial [Racocetra persica]
RVVELETENTEISVLKKKIIEVEAKLVILKQKLLQNDNTSNNSVSNDNIFNLI